MRKLTKKSLDEMANTMNVIPVEERDNYWGMNDCVLQCFAQVSGRSVDFWVITVQSNLGYNVYSNGGLNTSDIGSAGGSGGLTVNAIPNGTSYIFNNASGVTSSGATLMMTFNAGSADHAVIVTKITQVNGVTTYTYKDPQNGNAEGSTSNYSGMYALKY